MLELEVAYTVLYHMYHHTVATSLGPRENVKLIK